MNVLIYLYQKLTQMNVGINICIENFKNIHYSNIFEYSTNVNTPTHSRTNVRIYSYKQILHEQMSNYIHIRKSIRMNV